MFDGSGAVARLVIFDDERCLPGYFSKNIDYYTPGAAYFHDVAGITGEACHLT